MPRLKPAVIWAGLALALIVPITAAAFSPFLAWRDPVYIAAGFAGILGMSLMLAQPLLAGGSLPGLSRARGRRFHRALGVVLMLCVAAHVVGLWITSPPDVIDVLLLRSPTPFSIWGLLAMWAVFLAAGSVALRKRLGLRIWRRAHKILVGLAVIGTAVHVVLIEGAMEPISKVILAGLILAATLKTILDLRA